MGDCLHLSFIQKERGLDQRLPITCGTGVDDFHAFRQFTVNIFNSRNGGP